MEALGQSLGFILYRTKVQGPVKGELKMNNMQDRAIVYVDGKRQGAADRRYKQDSCDVVIPSGLHTVDIFVENMGRINFGGQIQGERKGIRGPITLDGKKLEIKRPQDAIDNGIVYVSEDRRDEGLILKNDVKFNMGLVCLGDFIRGVGVKHGAWDKMVEDYRKKFSIKITSSRQLTGNLSGGNQQKVVLSKWLAKKPKVIILDEPTRGIDVGSKAEIYAIIDELAAEGVSIIMVSSELPEIINMCNRCYVMCEGRITGELAEEEFSQESMMTFATSRE